MKKRFSVLAILICFVLVVNMLNCVCSGDSGVGIDLSLIKMSVKQGDSVSKEVMLNGLDDSNVLLGVVNIPGTKVSEESLFLAAGESKNIRILVDAEDVYTGVYVGYLSIKSGDILQRVPIVLEVESEKKGFDINLNIPAIYSEVNPGDSVSLDIDVFDLGNVSDGNESVNVEISYFVFRNDGTAIISETENRIVSHNSHFNKNILISDSLADGTYFVSAVIKHRIRVGVASSSFNVVKRVGGIKALSLSWAAALIFVIGLIGLFMLFFFLLVRDRDKFILALRRYHDSELRKQKEFLLAQSRFLINKGVPAKQVKTEIKSKVRALKAKQKAHMKELKSIGKSNNVNLMEKKVNEWKKRGYNTLLLESKLKDLSKKDMKSLISKWKKQGYVPPKK